MIRFKKQRKNVLWSLKVFSIRLIKVVTSVFANNNPINSRPTIDSLT
jgi:hypothetical protein